MSTPLKIGLGVLVVAATVGAGFLGARVASRQRAALSMSRPPQTGPQFNPRPPGFRDRDDRRGDDRHGRPDRRGDGRGRDDRRGPRDFGRPDRPNRRGEGREIVPGRWLLDYRADLHAAVASELGLSVEAYDKALAGGQTTWQIARSKGISPEDFQTKMQDAMSSVLKKAVADGKLTRPQADALLARMKQGEPRPDAHRGPWDFPRR